MNPDSVNTDIVRTISSSLNNLGLMYRIFSRSKTCSSVEAKIKSNPKYGTLKKIQDLMGIRIVLYFNDDIKTVRSIVSSIYQECSNDVSIDEVGKEEFRAVRYNIIYSLTDKLKKTLNLDENEVKFDETFELQIRTIFSEGWHEIEHDLRYKCKDDWIGFDSESRLLNGVYASLENSEWTMVKIFDELAYNHYKNKQWSSMLRQKLRIKFTHQILRQEISEVLDGDLNLAKKFFRVNRNVLISEMNKKEYYYPVSLNNIVYFMNILYVHDERIYELTPSMMIDDMKD